MRLARAAAVATKDAFESVMAEVFPAEPVVLAEGNLISEVWWGTRGA